MANLIYQYWDGELTVGCKAGVENMKQYAKRIGAEYLFEHNPRFVTNLGSYSPHYGAFKPIYDEKFHEYDNVLFADTDIFAIDKLEENIFENFNADVGICTEPAQPKLRVTTGGQITSVRDEKWASIVESRWNIKVPRTPEGLVTVYNSGVVMYSNKGLLKAKEKFVPFKEYVDMIKAGGLIAFYTCDQPYLHAMLEVADLDWIEMDNGWNSYIHYAREGNQERRVNDTRTKKTKFVHIQLAGADHWDANKLNRVANLPQDKWNIK
jgi:hypothetical protein